MIFLEEKTTLDKKRFEEWTDFDRMNLEPPGWGHKYRRALFRAACKYLGMDKYKVENILEIGVHSLLQSSSIRLEGSILEKVKSDSVILRKQHELIAKIKEQSDYKIVKLDDSNSFNIQLGGNRARGEMWKQALEFWKLTDEYSATWAVRSTNVKYSYVASIDGKITFNYNFSDTLDLRPSWGNRSMEYNAICYVLGFLYHDLLGGNDELEITGRWTATIN